MRSTSYADELRDPATVSFPDAGEARLERLRFKNGSAAGQDGYRFSWWTDGNIVMRPMDCTDDQFLQLFRDAMAKNLFPDNVLTGLREIIRAPR